MSTLYSNRSEIEFCNLIMHNFKDYFRSKDFKVTAIGEATPINSKWTTHVGAAQFSVSISPYTRKSRIALVFVPNSIVVIYRKAIFSNGFKQLDNHTIFLIIFKWYHKNSKKNFTYDDPDVMIKVAQFVAEKIRSRMVPTKQRLDSAITRIDRIKNNIDTKKPPLTGANSKIG